MERNSLVSNVESEGRVGLGNTGGGSVPRRRVDAHASPLSCSCLDVGLETERGELPLPMPPPRPRHRLDEDADEDAGGRARAGAGRGLSAFACGKMNFMIDRSTSTCPRRCCPSAEWVNTARNVPHRFFMRTSRATRIFCTSERDSARPKRSFPLSQRRVREEELYHVATRLRVMVNTFGSDPAELAPLLQSSSPPSPPPLSLLPPPPPPPPPPPLVRPPLVRPGAALLLSR